MLQKIAVDGIFLKLINKNNFPFHFHSETPQNIDDYFPLFSKKLLTLNPTICKHPILSNTNPFFFFSHLRSIMKFLYQLVNSVFTAIFISIHNFITHIVFISNQFQKYVYFPKIIISSLIFTFCSQKT